MDAETPAQHVDQVLRKADADGHVADGVLEYQVPAMIQATSSPIVA